MDRKDKIENYYIVRDYLMSDKGEAVRNSVLSRDNFKCTNCRGKASEVHYLTFEWIGLVEEADYCVSLCEMCHSMKHLFDSSKVLSITPSDNNNKEIYFANHKFVSDLGKKQKQLDKWF